MYLVPIQVPIFVDGERRLVTTDWKRSLLLLRDSLAGRFGDLGLAAPTLPASGPTPQTLVPIEPGDTIRVFPSFDARVRARQYWTRERSRWKGLLASLMPGARVVHAGFDEVYRPIAYEGFKMGLRHGKPTVFVQDTDVVLQRRELMVGGGLKARARCTVECRIMDRCMRFGVSRASLSLLKGGTLSARYERFARNLKVFEDTSYATSEIVPRETIEARLTTLGHARPLRFVYVGRLEARKGVDHSIRAIADAASRGANVAFDIIGDGGERASLEQLSRGLGAEARVRFLGKRAYGPALLRELASYDALLFTPLAEDTPRMIFDGYAAGLPIVGYGIEYVKHRSAMERAAIVAPALDVDALGREIAVIDAARVARLVEATRRACDAAPGHSADAWYAKRAEWTFEAVARHEHDGRAASGGSA